MKPKSSCINHPNRVADVHHVKTRGSGGDDAPGNLLYLCRECHGDVHALGMFKFCKKFLMTKIALRGAGFVFDENNKLRRVK